MYGDNPLVKILRDSTFHALGIAPIDVPFEHDFNKFLASLPPDEARKMKRKFRKLWRKAARAKDGPAKAYLEQLGLGVKAPNKRHKRTRKVEVLRRVNAEVLQVVAKTEAAEGKSSSEGDTL